MSESEHPPLAVVGMGCRYPGGVSSPEDLWRIAVAGHEVLTPFPGDRGWDRLENLHSEDPDRPGTTYVDRGGFLEDAAGFDPDFFGISPREATSMDPQQRVLLEVAWEAVERAGLDPAGLRGSRTGVFIGGEPREYGPRLSEAPDGLEAHLITGTTTSVLSGRIAYCLGLRGPALTVDTSASSSLVALHLAAQALRRDECELALAGGVSVMSAPGNFLAFSRLRALARDGRVKPFSADADGTVWSEGAGVVVLERLDDALRHGHRVLAVLRGTAINNDGASEGLTAPSGLAQQEAIRLALADAGLAAEDIDAVEAHGTGTPLGDRTEARALAAAYGLGRRPERPLLIGSLKSNIGHTQAAAGVAGVIKTVQALRHGLLPATLNITEPNPHVDWATSGLRLLIEATQWPVTGRPRRAGVSSFGLSGTNAHAVLEQAPSIDPAADIDAADASRPTAWLVSARSAAALTGQAERLAEYVASAPDAITPADIAWSLATTRTTTFDHRAVVVGTTREELTAGLQALAADVPSSAVTTGTAHDLTGDPARRVAFVFPGQGSQWVGMGSELIAASPVFAARLAECERALSPYIDWKVGDVLAGAEGAPSLDREDVIQPVLFAVMVSLAAVWQAAGVEPAAVVGHSQGEFAAACVANILSLEDAARVTALRSRIVQNLAGRGGMLAVAESPEAVERRLAEHDGRATTTIGVFNSPDAVVISGDVDVLNAIAADCEREDVRSRLLPIAYASHGPQIEAIRDELLAALHGIAPRPGTIAMVSTVTGETLDGTTAGPEYWYANARRPVQFTQAVEALDRAGFDAFIEISPHPVLTGAVGATLELARQRADATDLDDAADSADSEPSLLRPAPVVTGTLRRDAGGLDRLLTSLAEVHVRGVRVDWPRILPSSTRQVDLPTYAFEHRRFWLNSVGSVKRAVTSVPEAAVPSVGGLRGRIAGRPAGEQLEILLELVQAHTAAVLGRAADDAGAVQPGRTFKEIGLDSMGGVELRTRLNTAIGLQLPTTLIFDCPNPATLAGFLRTRLLGTADSPTAPNRVVAVAGHDEPIAIVAMSCRFPGGVEDPESLWNLVAAGGDAIGAAPTDRGWNLDELGADSALRGGYLPDAGDFDPAFFGISPREALAMDPQQRLLLELSWEAFERAGISAQSLRGSATGVFFGAAASGYGDDGPRELEGHLRTGSATSVISGRVAYTFGFEGPAMTVDTACSSSLVAVHLAAQALRGGECELALAGGVTVHATASWLTWFTAQHGLASDGRCKAFSASADGMGMAEGAGIVLLERLSDARRNGHQVLAVVRGSAVNQDGASNGLTAPNGPSQQRVIRAALASGRLGTQDVDVVEAHGTGTMLGDPIEAQALIATYGEGRDADEPLLLGTVKSNLGHTQWAAGAAGIIKMVLALQHAHLPRTLHADEPSPHVDWSAGTVRLLNEPTDWPELGRPRRAGVSAFGISGTNAHVILEQAPATADETRPHADNSDVVVPWLISARDNDALVAQAHRLREFVDERPELAPVDVAWSLAFTRSALSQRAVVVGVDRDELLAGLGDLELAGSSDALGKVGFVFTGQGAQRVGMGRGLYAAYPVFAEAFDAVCVGLEEHLDGSVSAVIDGAQSLDDTMWAQAGLFAVEVALFRLLESWGVTPSVLAGHSIGELAAAHVAGVWSLSDACAVVAARGRLMQALPIGGAMLAIAAPEDEVLAALSAFEGVDIAAVNGPSAVVVSGPAEVVSAVREHFEAREVRVRSLRVSHAFHSSLMEPMLAEFAEVTASASYAAPHIPIVSTLTGRQVTDELQDPGYWVRQVREAVRFADAVSTLRESGVRTFVELGPDAILTALGATTEDADEAWLPTLRRDRDEPRTLVTALGQLHNRGADVDWSRFFAGTNGRRVDLPTYAFTRQRYWLARSSAGRPHDIGLTASGHPLLGTVVELPATGGMVLAGRLSVTAQPWLADHLVGDRIVVPGAALVEMAIRAGDEVGAGRLAELVIQSPMVLSNDRRGISVRISVGEPTDEHGHRDLAIHSRPEDGSDDWTEHAAGVLAPAEASTLADVEAIIAAELRTWPPAGAVAGDLTDLYPELARSGLPYGPTFQGVRRAWRRGETLYVEVALGSSGINAAGMDVAGFGLHPALLDAALHLTARPAEGRIGSGPLLPFAWTDSVIHATGASTARVRIAPSPFGEGVSLIMVDGADPQLIATVGSLVLRPLPAAATGSIADEALFELNWVPAELSNPAATTVPGNWAVLGPEPLTALPPTIFVYEDVAALSAAIADGVPVPEFLVFRPRASSAEHASCTLPELARATTLDALSTVRGFLLADETMSATRLLVLTERAVDAGAGAGAGTVDIDLTAAGVWGLIRVAQSEQPDRIVLVDVDRFDAEITGSILAAVGSGEAQIAVRAGQLLVPRLAKVSRGLALPADADTWRLEITERGTLDNLVLAASDRGSRTLAAHEVRVGLRAAGVNFRDVLNVLGMYPGDPGLLGLEGAGVVLEAGSGVTNVRPGDRVMGLFSGAFTQAAITDARLVAPIPAGWTFAEAAAAPVVYLTAWHALVALAELNAGESVLIHAAAGGVGTAAVQIARHLGADVFGTASPSKWAQLRELGLDDTRLASSRTLDFESTFRAATGGAGVDVVLDSLAGEFVDASLRLAAGHGSRFIEIGKADIRDATQVADEHGGLAYQAFDLLELDPEQIARMFAELSGLFAGQVLRPLPVVCWDVRAAPEAFRYLSQARNVGKLVLTMPASATTSRPTAGTTLITGASGALGGLIARHLAASEQTEALLLLSRRGPQAPRSALLAAELAELGTDVRLVAADVADPDHLSTLLVAVPAESPLRNVIHAAGVLDDGVIHAQTADRVDAVLRPKVDGAWNLHRFTRHMDLDRFVLFSSVAALWGNPGQSGYAAANTFLDALAAYRHRSGLPATSLAWGPWQLDEGTPPVSGGMASTLTEADWQRMARQGLAPHTAKDGLGLLDAAATLGQALLVPTRLDVVLRPGAAYPALLSGLTAAAAAHSTRTRRSVVGAAGGSTTSDGARGELAQRLAALPTESEREEALRDVVRLHTAFVLGMPGPEAVEATRTFKQLGIDSLTAVELRNRLNSATATRLPAGVVFDYPTPSLLAGFLGSAVLPEASGVGATTGPSSTVGPQTRQAINDGDEFVIVGIGCRFAGGVGSAGEFWDLVSSGTDVLSPFPEDRGPLWDEPFAGPADEAGESYARVGAFLDDADEFDAQFFGISPREALAMDPQQRLLLETSWEALEDAGIDPGTLHGTSTGVFAGLIYHDYGAGAVMPDEVQGYLSTGGSGGVASGRVSYALGLEGPAVTVDTACSSSLVALHLAVQALRSGECTLALAGGVTVMATPATFLEFARQRGLSSDGRCKAYAAGADGTGWGEGVGVLVVERLLDARRNGHRVLAVIRATAVNQDGASNGLTAPNGPSQQRVIRAALETAGLQTGDVDVIEGHGTGTRLGDPIEAEALIATYGQGRSDDRPVLLGSVKSNIGHTQAAAGVAGVIKMVQAMAHGVVPPTLHVDTPSSHVDWQSGSVRLVTETTAWPETGDRPRRAGVSSFGFSGTNAHVILEQPPTTPDEPRSHPDVVVVVPWLISARDNDSLTAQAHRLREFVDARPELHPLDVAWSLASTRSALSQRAVVVGADRDELLTGLEHLELTGTADSLGKLGFVFTGQGAQRVGMGRGLYAAYPVFADAFDAVIAGLEEHLDGSVRAVIDGAGSLDDTMWAQAGLFAIEVALFRLLESWGVTPSLLAGHSIGELAAAHVAGVWSLSDACAVVAARGRLMQALPTGGAMLSVRATEDEVRQVIAEFEGVDVAAVNGPSAVVVSGPAELVDAVREHFEVRDVRARSLRVSHAFHSSLMEPMLAEFAEVTASVSYAAPRIPIISTLTGRQTTDELQDPEYWVRQVREAVRFADAVSTLREAGVRTFVELGPDAILTALGATTATTEDDAEEAWLPTLRRDRDEPRTLVTALGQLHNRGADVDWSRFYAGTNARRTDLPTYAFTRQRYWLDAATGSTDPSALGQSDAAHPLLGASVRLASGGVILTGRLSLRTHPWLGEHVVAGRIVVPGTALVEMAIRAGDETGQARLAELVIEAPMQVGAEGGTRIQVTVEAADATGRSAVTIHSQPDGDATTMRALPWTRHATGVLESTADREPAGFDLAEWPPVNAIEQDHEALYPTLAEAGLEYGPTFRAVRKSWRRGDELFAEVALAEGTAVSGFGIHPALLDACLHLLGVSSHDESDSPRVPFAWTDVEVHAAHATTVRVRLAPAVGGDGMSIILTDGQSGTLPVASVRAVALRALPAAGFGKDDATVPDADALFEIAWNSVRLDSREDETGHANWAVLSPLTQPESNETPHYADVAELVAAVSSGTPVPDVVLLPIGSPHDTPSTDAATTARTLAVATLGVIQAWLAADNLAEARLLVVTNRAVDAGPGAVPDPAAASVQGLLRVAIAENPGRFVLADIDYDIDSATTDNALLAAGLSLGEPEFAIRQGEIRIPRFVRPAAALPVPQNAESWRLDFTERGTLENLVLATDTAGTRALEPGEVRVGLRAAGVNFRDVLNVLGMYPGEAGQLGLEGAGMVLEVGPETVTDLVPGDRVMGLFPAAFGPVAVTDVRRLAKIPDGWTLTEAAAAPVVFLTAYYALVDLAELHWGERVLIHAAAGGVGIAAVQLAAHLGAEVFGTASPSKWSVLRELGLPQTHIASSRTLEFEEAFRSATGGAGVDVVLDSLAGDFVDASLRLATGSGRRRFVEMGKTDIRDAAQVAADHDGLVYRAFDLFDTPADRIAAMFAALSELFAQGVLKPLPVAAWDVRRAPDAFRHLSQARNVGKVVLTIPAAPTAEFSGTTLITGASGALGGLIARHLAATNQAERLILLSRRGPQAPGAGRLAADVAEQGLAVQIHAADVANRDQLTEIIARVPESAPLRGVVHAAGLLDDGVIGSLTPDRVDSVLRPKVDGAWHLHELTRDLDLNQFILFSSIAGVWGNPGQGNYAAANTFLDALAAQRRAHGLSGLSLAWGPWQQHDDAGSGHGSSSGMAASLSRADWKRLSRSGSLPLTDREGLALLDAAATGDRAMMVPVHLDAAALAASGDVAPLLSTLIRRASRRGTVEAAGASVGHGPGPGNALATRFAASADAEQQAGLLLDLIYAQTALVLGLPGSDAVNARDTFKDLGIDSLTSLELRNKLNVATGLRLPATVVFDYPTPTTLAEHIRTELTGELPALAATNGSRSAHPLSAPSAQDELAIVGIGCRFPGGVGSAAEFWQLLADGTDTVAGFPVDRGSGWGAVYDQDPEAIGKSYASEGAFLYDAGAFDAQFFGISPREALAMDPQQRLLLETSWEALEDAGIDPTGLRGSETGVFAGLIYHDYATGGATPDELEGYVSTGTSAGVASGRVSYALGLEGPAVTVDTACSSSLVALHLAAQSLRSGECGLALVGGVTVMAQPGTFIEFSRQRGLALDGRCKAYAEAADGTGWGEGVGVLVVERLSDARRNGHRVLALIRGTAVNQDGASNGLTAPNGPSQQRVIRSALASAGLRPGEVDVVEGHGTGTRLGDPIEAQALLATYGQNRPDDHPVLLGSVKSNIGHTQAAAGVAGVIKMVQAMAHGVVPATLHVDAPSSHVDWEAGSIRLVSEATAWPETGRPRRASVSSFGFSGTNAHVILEQASATPDQTQPHLDTVVVPWLISARDNDALTAQAHRLRKFVDARPELHPLDIAWSLASTRSALARRTVVVGADRDELLSGLGNLELTSSSNALGKVGFVFTGQGAQRVGMGRGLYAAYPVFADAFDAVCAGLEEHLDGSVRAVIDGAGSLDDTMWAQAGLFAIEVALFRLLESWGVTPSLLAGHSIGELAAAHVAGVWSLSDACAVVAARGRLMQALPTGGSMLAIAAPEADVLAALSAFEGVDIAAVNGPSAVVVSGLAERVDGVRQHFETREIRVRSLRVSHAFHSSLMEPMLAEFAEVTASVSYAPPRIPIVSTLTGRQTTDELQDPGYWVRQVREAVRFADAVSTLRESGVHTFVELGPDAILTALGATTATTEDADEAWLPTLRRDRDEPRTLVTALGQLHNRGADVDWSRFYAGTNARRVDLPTYAFTRQHYWLNPSTDRRLDAAALGQNVAGHPLLGAALDLSSSGGLVLTGRLSLTEQPWLAEHVVAGRVVVPGAALVEMAIRAGDEAGCARLAELVIQAPLVLDARDAVRIQVSVAAPDEDGTRQLTIHSRRAIDEPGDWTQHATGVLAIDSAVAASLRDEWPPRDATPEDVSDLYQTLATAGLSYGPLFRGVRKAWRRGDEVYAEVALDEGTAVNGFGIHPALLDASLHLMGSGNQAAGARPMLPFAWTDVEVHSTGATIARVLLAPAESGEGISVTLVDETGALIASVGSLVLRALPVAQEGANAVAADALYELDWSPAVAIAEAAQDIDTSGWVLLGGSLNLPGVPRYPDIKALTADSAASPSRTVVIIAPCGFGRADGACGETAEAIRATTADALAVVQSWLAAEDLAAGSRLVLLTRQAVDAGATSVDLAGAGVWGLARVAAAENPGRITVIDLDALADADPVQALTAALATGEAQVAVRAGQVLVPRLARASAGLALPVADGESETSFWRLDFTGKGTLENLTLVRDAAGARELGPGEVRVSLRAAGVNFRDVLNVLGMYPGEAGLLGLEGAGTVLEVGNEVHGLKPGDRVMGLFSGAFGPLGVTDARLLTAIPAGWTMTQAAAAPVAYLTAWYALVVLADLKPRESVLIHAAAGGVGIAAVQVARHLGADVFGTASPAKWPVLRGLGLADSRIASSRTVEFEGAFRTATGGSGIDVVLDSLAGEFVDASLRLSAGPGRRFIEMGKTDIRDPQRVAAEHDGLAYQAFDLFAGDPELLASMFSALSELFAQGAARPLPVTAWDVRRAPEAFRHLSQARNVGKVVLTMPTATGPTAPSSGTILITGASGALGGLVARHLAERGGSRDEAEGRRLALLSRRGPSAPGTARLAAELAESGVDALVIAGDAADRSGLAAVIADLGGAQPLRGVVHAAGVLDDAVMVSLTPDMIETVLRPKVDGALNLHDLTADLDLDRFVLFSSVAGVWGNPGQGNYAAANTVLDALAASRRRAGFPATSLAWGPWELDAATSGGTGGGMAGTLSDADRRRLARQGFAPLTAADGLALLDAATAATAATDSDAASASTPGVGRALLVAARLDLAALRAQGGDGIPPVATDLIARSTSPRPATGPTRRIAGTSAAATDKGDDAAARLAAMDPQERGAAIRDVVVAQAALVLGLSGAQAVEVSRSFRELGFDSLTAVELRNRLGTATGVRLGAAAVFDHPTPDALAAHINRQLGGDEGKAASNTGNSDDRVLEAFAGLEKVESALAGILDDAAGRARVAARVQDLLLTLRAAQVAEEEPDDGPELSVADRIDAADDDDIFDFIDKELGI